MIIELTIILVQYYFHWLYLRQYSQYLHAILPIFATFFLKGSISWNRIDENIGSILFPLTIYWNIINKNIGLILFLLTVFWAILPIFGNIALLFLRTVSSFYCQYFQGIVNISAIFEFYCKYLPKFLNFWPIMQAKHSVTSIFNLNPVFLE